MKFTPIIVAGLYLETRVNSFEAETIALEHATAELKAFLLVRILRSLKHVLQPLVYDTCALHRTHRN